MPPISEEGGMEDSPALQKKSLPQIEPPDDKTRERKTSGNSVATQKHRSWSMSSGEYELYQATNPHRKNLRCNRWSIPDTDSEDDIIIRAATNPRLNLTSSNRQSDYHRFNLPSDSDEENEIQEENPYDLAMSPTSSIQSAEPPLPPPVSSIPTRLHLNRHTEPQQGPGTLKQTKAMPLPKVPEVETNNKVPSPVTAEPAHRKVSIASESETDHYDEIGNNSTMSSTGQVKSEPRFTFSLNKSKKRLNPDHDESASTITYAEIPKKPQWNFPSSDEDECEETEETPNKKKTALKSGKPPRRFSRQESSTSEEGERPHIPPKLWETSKDMALSSSNSEEEQEDNVLKSTSDPEIKDSDPPQQEEVESDDVIIEYNTFQKSQDENNGSLLGPDEEEEERKSEVTGNRNSPTFTHSSGFGDNNDTVDASSITSETSSRIAADYEQSSACVDMDQLSLDSSGKHPKRIVETHETHEIIPAENCDDDIVERIIETQTITEKLDDNPLFKEYGGEDFSKYLEDDDEFVSHIFTLGRTMEKGHNQKKKPKDFAFVENPFSPPEPMIETKPIEKKTVKQKITTLVKKKKQREEESLYAEVKPNTLQGFSFTESKMYNPENDLNDPLNGSLGSSFLRDNGIRLQAEEEEGISEPKNNNKEALVYETVEELTHNNFMKITKTEKRKEPKTEKKSIFRGLRKLLRKNKSQDSEKANSVTVEDDYQEFVP